LNLFQIRSKIKEIYVRDYINYIFDGFQHDIPLWTTNCDCSHRRIIDHRKMSEIHFYVLKHMKK